MEKKEEDAIVEVLTSQTLNITIITSMTIMLRNDMTLQTKRRIESILLMKNKMWRK